MNRQELKRVEAILVRIKDPDAKVAHALALVRKDLSAYEARKGQLRDSYEADLRDLSGW